MRKLVFTLMIVLSFCSLGFAQNVIEPELQNALNQKGDEMISVNIILKSQMDSEKLKACAAKATDKHVRRNIMIDELKLFSEKEQQEIMSILKAEAKSNRVADIKGHWMTNYINCTTTRDVIYLLAQHPDVMMIGYNQEKYLLWDEKAEKIEASREELTENITMVNADDVWAMGYTGDGVVVAVIDTGVNYEHVDVADHLWDGGAEFPHHGYNTYYNNNDPMDKFGHGSHCAGTVCGDGTSGTKTGMAPNATLMCVKALSDSGSGTVDHINNGMEWAIEHQADVLSLSLGIPNSTTTERTILRRTCVNALNLGIVAAIACGNEGNMQWQAPIPNNVRVPGSCPPPWLHPDQADVNPGELSCAVSVGAVKYNDVAADFSSHGPVTWQETEFADYAYSPGIGLIRPDVCAPGEGIISLDFSTNTGHIGMNGTSMAAPCVAGIMALMLEKKADLTPAEICMILETTGVKLTDKKDNVTGSSRVDALAAIEAINNGSFLYVSHSINDDESGNGNANINAMEQAKLNVTFTNNSEESYTNLKAVLRTNNILVRVDDSIAEVNSISANETISINDEFAFTVDITASCRTLLAFDVCFYDSNDEFISSVRVPVFVKSSDVQVASVIIKNDDNGNGILEAGETADFGVILNNMGNELEVAFKGNLLCEDSDITINTSEAYFNSIGAESSTVAFYNVTLSENVSDVFSIPFILNIENEFMTKELEFSYANACNIIFELKDDYGDGWDGAILIVKYSDGTPDEAFTVASGSSKTYTRQIGSGVEVSLEWVKGSWDLECSFIIKKENGAVIYKNGGFLDNGFLFSWVNDCSIVNNSYEMCEPVQNLTNNTEGGSKVNISWEAPANGEAIAYEVYRDSRYMGTTEELSYTDETVIGRSIYTYSVRPVYEECFGTFENIEVTYFDGICEDIINDKVSIYPNPSNNDFNIVCENMTRVRVYNVMGAMISDKQVGGSKYVVSGLESGIYFINIETSNGNVTRKVVRF
ncbi:MAG: S8 family serine peptidase [Bacteroidales bacterium]|nr:S8 family serine peptidase [Bacteroidales bacterium]